MFVEMFSFKQMAVGRHKRSSRTPPELRRTVFFDEFQRSLNETGQKSSLDAENGQLIK